MRVDFYVLQRQEAHAVLLIACRLLEKAYQQGHSVFVYCNHLQDAETLDELLWSYKADSFIPHHLQGEGPEPPPPVQIGYIGEPRGFNDILLNLADRVPDFYTRFKRVIEIVAAEDSAKAIRRDNFRSYCKAGLRPQTHTLE